VQGQQGACQGTTVCAMNLAFRYFECLISLEMFVKCIIFEHLSNSKKFVLSDAQLVPFTGTFMQR